MGLDILAHGGHADSTGDGYFVRQMDSREICEVSNSDICYVSPIVIESWLVQTNAVAVLTVLGVFFGLTITKPSPRGTHM